MRLAGAAIFALCSILVFVAAAPAAGEEPSLREIEQRIFDDDRELRRMGIFVTGARTDEDRDLVIIDVITRRDDVKQVMTDRYGPKVRVKVIARRLSRLIRTPWQEYTPTRDGRSLRIWWCTNSAYGLERIRVRASRRRVAVTIVERAPNGPTTDAARCRSKYVHLRRPLGGRVVIDGATGKRRPLGRLC